MRNRIRIVMIHLNRIDKPRTGGEYVYRVIYEELVRRGYEVVNISSSMISKWLSRYDTQLPRFIKGALRIALEPFIKVFCLASSLYYFGGSRHVVITSASPDFPVFGDLTYHQPPAGIEFWKKSPSSLYEHVSNAINAVLNPVWNLSKKMMIHISNSYFTVQLVRKLYGVNSIVIYPPVPLRKILIYRNRNKPRENCILVNRLILEGGALLLPLIAKHLPSSMRLVIIGRMDYAGKRVLKELKRIGVKFTHLGFVDEETKNELLHRCMFFLHLGVNETFGISVVEAMAAGAIPVAHRSGAVPEYLPAELTYLYPREAADRIRDLLSRSRRELEELRERLQRRAAMFREEVFREKIARLVEKIAEEKTRA
ncbi:hypothetical protein PYJP_17000 [Pyrofollis japonicus]|uniref:glycosyltransferase n=1 Tax=Pyrofollis japonicus TaxID=3060460 RepID=UPI00295BCE0A|nr:glycosyltransferase [Pyrofollis japonicus]BEP18348.1 hypothetical protein PYJP_17000 [Pyrofollis japonicus]